MQASKQEFGAATIAFDAAPVLCSVQRWFVLVRLLVLSSVQRQ
jgi:hypothetical protein